MIVDRNFRQSLKLGVSSAAVLIGLASAVPAIAQTADATQTAPQTTAPAPVTAQDLTDPAQAADQAAPADVVVTGSLFRNKNAESISPLTVLTTETLQRANITTINDAIRSVSADSAGSISTGFRNGFSAGGAAVSLRGLGVSSTVILIDGLRSTNFPLNDDGHNAYVDLNSIPFSIVDRVEVLKDGASSTYGADAIGGVVNLITKKHFKGLEASAQGGTTEQGDGSHYRATATVGFGDYETKGFNAYLNGEYTYDGFITNNSRGYPFNTLDLTPTGTLNPAGGTNDRNRGDDSITTASPQAVVIRAGQTDLNNPLAGSAVPLGTTYQLLNPNSCPFGTFTVSNGTGCKHNLPNEYFIIQPKQQRYSASGRVSLRVNDTIEAYATGSWSHSEVFITGAPTAIRQTQPFTAPNGALASSNPGIVLPVYVCSAGVNCSTAADRRLNPNNPYAVAGADPSTNAARIYYLFGDLPQGTDRYNDVYRTTAGLTGSFGNGYDFRVEGVYASDAFKLTQHGFLNIPGILNAINTGAYNFVNPQLNSQAVRNQVSPDVTTRSRSSLLSLDGSIAKSFFTLPGGDLKVAIGGQVRRETLNNRNQNALINTYGLNTSSAVGRRTVAAGFFEIDAPILSVLDVDVSGRYDHYSEGYGHFSPKVGVKFTPIPQIAFRGTYAEGFRAPTFAEENPLSQYAGFSGYAPPASFRAAHALNPAYYTTYNIGQGANGNPNLVPEVSRSLTLGAIFQPVRWFNLTVDYYNIKKSNLIVSGPLRADAINAYYQQTNSTAGCAAVAATGPGYSCNVIDAVDPSAPAALPRLLILNVPFVNANYEVSSGLDFQATATVPVSDRIRFTSRVDVTDVLRLDLVTPSGVVQKYAGTLGPYELSSGGGTPKIRGNWQNTLEYGPFSLTATTYYVGRIKQVAADEIAAVNGAIDLSCTNALPGVSTNANACYVRPFMYVDVNAGVKVNDQFRFFVNVQNVGDARAPLAAGAYTSNPNYLSSWHYAGLVGRNYSAGVSIKF